MAHTCPGCGQACYCGGDIDDVLMDGTDEEAGCMHCPDDEPEDYEDSDLDDYADMNADDAVTEALSRW